MNQQETHVTTENEAVTEKVETLAKAEDNLVDIAKAKKGPNKNDLKRMQIHEQRIQRWLANHTMTPEQFEALKGKIKASHPAMEDKHMETAVQSVRRGQAEEAIAKEDWENLPNSTKFTRLVNMCASQQRTINVLQQDLMNLRYNDQSISDAFEINHRGLQILLMNKGFTQEELNAAFTQAQNEFNENRKKAIEAQRKAQEPASVDASLQALEKQLKEKPEQVGAEPPAEATVFSES